MRFRIIGVSRNATDTLTYPRSFADNLRGETARTFYPAVLQFKDFERYPQVLTYQLRADVDPDGITGLVTNAFREFTPAISLTRVRTINEQVRELIRQQLNIAQLSLTVSVAALLLACIGLCGLLAHLVTRRTNEIGIRMALGARPPEVLWMVLREMTMLVTIGCVIGVPVSLAAARLVRSQFFGLEPGDVLTPLVSMAVTLSVGALAAYVPARRAARIDPLLAIRTE
jgi:ABC-type antimicrobial peptide transport system permease subunit